jgi:hypothetical protein
MKKQITAAILAAVTALIALGGCEQQGDVGEGGWTYSVKNAPIYDSIVLGSSAITGVSGHVMLSNNDMVYDGTLVVGTLTDGLLTFALPDTVPESKLTAYFAHFEDNGTVDPMDHNVFLPWSLEVYDDDEQYLGDLNCGSWATQSAIQFLYSKAQLTVAVDDVMDIEAVRGWNCILMDMLTDFVENGSPPPDAKWVYHPVPPPYEEL